jgi:hypothetical protein
MPLSDHERRMLAEMEAAMAQEDPKLVSTLTGRASISAFSASYRRLSVGAGLIFLGMATIIAGLVAKITLVGIAGFGIALLGALAIVTYFTLRANGNLGAAGAEPGAKGAARGNKGGKGKGSTWSQRMEERWERRNFDN